MTDLKVAIQLSTEGGEVVVKSISAVKDSAEGANDELNKTEKAGKAAGRGLNESSKEARELDGYMRTLRNSAGMVAATLGVVGAGAFFKSTIDEHEQLQRNLLRTEAIVQSMGGVVGWSADQLHQQARAVAAATLQSTEGVMRAQQVMMTYSTITHDTFSDAIKLAVDLSTLMDQSLQTSVEQLARALDDPIGGLQALARSGYRFADSQIAAWAEMANTNRLAEAQAGIMAELKTQVGGLAEREAMMLAGAQDTLGQALQEAKIGMVEHLDINTRLTAMYLDGADAINTFTTSLTSGDLDGYITLLSTAGTITAALLAAKAASPIAGAIWARTMKMSAAASGAFAAQNALTVKSMFSVRTAAFAVAAAFAGWQIGTYLREEFEVVERAGIALTSAVHRGLVWLGSEFDVLKETMKLALTSPLSFLRNQLTDFLQWLTSLGSRTLGLLGLDDVFSELEGKLEGIRSKTGAEHKATIAQMRANTAEELRAMDDIYADMFASVGRSAGKAGDVLEDTGKKATLPDQAKSSVDDFNQALLTLYNQQKLAAEAIDSTGRSLTGIDLEIFRTQFIEAGELPKNAAVAIREFAAAVEAAQAITNADTYLQNLYAENDLLRIRLAHGEDEYEIQKALFLLKGGDPAVLAAIEEELRLQQALNEQIRITEEISSGAFGTMLDDLTEMGRIGAESGDVLLQTFGRVAQQLSAVTAEQVKYAKQLDVVAEKRKEAEELAKGSEERAKALLAIERTEMQLKQQHFQMQMGQYSSLAGAAAQMFGEQSKEREKLHQLEMAFGAVEMAMAMQKAMANALVGITNQASGDPYSAPMRMAAMAAIMAGLGVFSGSVSGGGISAADRQETQSTGTVLGDSSAKSSSVANVLERIASQGLDQYNELRGINAAIQSLSRGIASLAVNLVQARGQFNGSSGDLNLGGSRWTDGWGTAPEKLAGWVVDKFDPISGAIASGLGQMWGSIIGGLSRSSRELIDSGLSFNAQEMGNILATGLVDAVYYDVIEQTDRQLWGIVKSTDQKTEFTALDAATSGMLARIFGHLNESITKAIDVLGWDAQQQLENYVIDLPHVSFKDLTGDEIAAELEAMFSSQADLMAEYVLPGIAAHQKKGEGLFETLMRVAQEQAVFNYQIESLGIQLSRSGELTAEAQTDVAQSIIGLMGGLDQFRTATGEYFTKFYSDAEQFNRLTSTLNQEFDGLGRSMPLTRDGLRELVDGIDYTTESGQALFATLMNLAPAMDALYTGLERRAEAEQEWMNELLRMDMSPFRQQLDDLQTWYDEQIAMAESLGADTTFLERLYARQRTEIVDAELGALNDAHERSVNALVADYDKLYASMDRVSQGIADAILSIQRQGAGWSEVGYQTGVIDDLRGQVGQGSAQDQIATIGSLQGAIMARYRAEQDANKQLQSAQQQRYQQEKAAVDAMRQAAKQLLSTADALLLSADSPALLGEQLREAQSQFDALFSRARGGDADAARELQSVGSSYLSIAKDFYAQGSSEYEEIFEKLQTAFRSIGGMAINDPPVSRAVLSYQRQDTALQQAAIAELEELQALMDELRADEQAAQEAAAAALVVELQNQTRAILDASQAQVSAIERASNAITASVRANNAPRSEAGPQTDRVQVGTSAGNDAVVAELRSNAEKSEIQNQQLRTELARVRTDLARTQDMVYRQARTG